MKAWTRPHTTQAQWQQDDEECEEEARLEGPLVHEHVYEDCMEERGYRRAD